jgi:hypothetical protein
VRFGYVPPPFGALWPDIEALLDKAVAKGGNRWGDVKAALARETAQLWLTMDDGPVNATVTRMDGKTLEIWLCGGRGIPWALPYLETIIAAAKHAGATDARIIGRKGWKRALRPFGWIPRGDELLKEWAA